MKTLTKVQHHQERFACMQQLSKKRLRFLVRQHVLIGKTDSPTYVQCRHAFEHAKKKKLFTMLTDFSEDELLAYLCDAHDRTVLVTQKKVIRTMSKSEQVKLVLALLTAPSNNIASTDVEHGRSESHSFQQDEKTHRLQKQLLSEKKKHTGQRENGNTAESTTTIESEFGKGDAFLQFVGGLSFQYGAKWTIGELHEHLRLAAPRKFSVKRFRELAASLLTLGVDIRLVHEEKFAATGESPTLDDLVLCKRLIPQGADILWSSSDNEQVVQSDKPAVHTQIIVVQADRPLIDIAKSRERTRIPYELALMRLQFLTAVPSMSRQQHANWPHHFLREACFGLELSDSQKRLLLLAARAYVRGAHDPLAVANELFDKLFLHEWNHLLQCYITLNTHAVDFVTSVIDTIRSRLTVFELENTVSVDAVNDTKRDQELERHVSPIRHGQSVSLEQPHKHRSLGVLNDMFA